MFDIFINFTPQNFYDHNAAIYFARTHSLSQHIHLRTHLYGGRHQRQRTLPNVRQMNSAGSLKAAK